MGSPPRCSIVIRCFNEEEHIGKLLTGVAAQTVRDVQIVVVDSGSTDASLAIASRFPVEIVSIASEDFSFGRSLNLGCERARGEFVVIASAHVYPVRRDWLELLLAPFSDPKVALVYGKQRGNERTRYSEHRLFSRWFPDQSNPDQDTPFCNNANAAIRRSLFSEFRYDETLTGLEDLDWANRVMKAGYKIAYQADAEIVHVHDETARAIFARYQREAIALKRVFPTEHMSLAELARLLPANVFADWYHAFRDGELAAQWRDVLLFRTMQLAGTYRGFSRQGPLSRKLKQTFYYPGALEQPGPPRPSGRAAGDPADGAADRRIDYSRYPPPKVSSDEPDH